MDLNITDRFFLFLKKKNIISLTLTEKKHESLHQKSCFHSSKLTRNVHVLASCYDQGHVS